MGNHRMFSNTVVDTDLFLDMPLSSQALYFHLGMKADDYGFVGNPKKVVRSVNCSQDDLLILISKGFVIAFESGIIVITHWTVHNHIRKDRKKDTIFQTEKAMLQMKDGKAYTTNSQYVNQLTANCQPNDNQTTAQDKVSKDKISEDKSILSSSSDDASKPFDFQTIIDSFNFVYKSLPPVKKLTETRQRKIKAASKTLGDITFEEFFQRIESSDFLTGRSGGDWQASFDWVLQPQNTVKIVEGNYDNKAHQAFTADYSEGF